ncbi:MAG: hypothetical protein NUW01_19860 [Gemmatimonadaceae bacterium]|nr:hypothetical protein [Gemmatimonadaceae bacterium]
MKTLVALLLASLVMASPLFAADNETSQGNKHVRIVKVEVGDDRSVAVTVQVTPYERDQDLVVWLFRLVEGQVQYNHTDAALAGHRGMVDKAGADGSEAHPAIREVWTDLARGTYLAKAELTRVGADGEMVLPSNAAAFEVGKEPERESVAPGERIARERSR